MPNYHSRTEQHLQGIGQYSTNMEIAASLLALPSRGGLTLQEVAERSEISERQLRNWRQDPRFQALVRKKMKDNVSERMPDVMDALLDKAINDKSAKHIELLLKYQGELTERHEVATVEENKPVKLMSNDELQAELDELSKLIEEAKGEDKDVIDAEFEEIDEELDK